MLVVDAYAVVADAAESVAVAVDVAVASADAADYGVGSVVAAAVADDVASDLFVFVLVD